LDLKHPSIVVAATKPKQKIAGMLAGLGVEIIPVEEDEGNVDRYILSKRLAIERRTGSSFLKGIMEKTLFTSAVYLREHYRIPVLIIEGSVNYQYSMMDPQAVRGALSSMMLLYGINVLSTPKPEETAQLIAMMARQEQVGIPEISLIPKRKATSLDDQQRRMVEMLPGSGMVMARELLHHFGSVRRIANAEEDEFRAVRGIGVRKAREIWRVLSAEYESVDTERQLEDAMETDPSLLFDEPVEQIARQHVVFTLGDEKQVVDLVFRSKESDELILVELKRGKLDASHEAQLCRYLDHAAQSRLLRKHLNNGASLRGILATAEPCAYKSKRKDIDVVIADRKRVIAVLNAMRSERLKATGKSRS
jgi:ERCC4-type nuclease